MVELKDLSNIKIFYKANQIDGYEARSFIFPNGIRIVSYDTLNYLLALIRGERDELLSKISKVTNLEKKLEMARAKADRYKREIEELKKDKKEIETMYGKYVSPFTIIEELYRGISHAYMILNKRRDFQIKISPKQFNYWVGIFIDLKILRRIDKSNLQSIRNYTDAHNVLYQNDYTWIKREKGEIDET
jgi:hypothetical protein